MKKSIYIRIFCVFMVLFIVLATAFTAFYINGKKQYEISSFLNKIQMEMQEVEDFYGDYTEYLDGEKGMTAEDLMRIHLAAGMLDHAFAIYDLEYELIWNSQSKYFCSYFVPYAAEGAEGEIASGERGVMELEKYFYEEDAEEIKGYLDYCDKDADIGEIKQYGVNIKGLWTDGFVVIPEALEIMVMRVTESKLSEDGGESWADSTGLSGHYLKEIKALKTNISGLSYYNEGYIYNNDYLLGYENEHNYSAELQKLNGYVTDKEVAEKAVEAKMSSVDYFQAGVSDQCYLIKEEPMTYICVYAHSIAGHNEEETEAQAIFAHSINIWELYGKEMILILFGSLAVFIVAAWITASQIYRSYIKKSL
ncbi:MAG: hypothetical protein E7228_05170 [Clostridiales bacterium]|nr:hypothetical protein [Clostridiales bacterium]